jgi:hypothetical protein
MRKCVTFLIVILIGCQSKSDDKTVGNSNSTIKEIKSKELEKIDEDEKRFRDSLYNRESDNFISKLDEIPNRDSNAYKLTISLKNGKKLFTKILNTRPQRSMINYCTDLYTVVGFSCGGPCYSQVFVFTDKNRPSEQYGYAQRVIDYPNIIAHIKNEEFEKLFVRNFNNGKELKIDISDGHLINYGHMDTMYIVKNDLVIMYPSNKKLKKKIVNIESILK